MVLEVSPRINEFDPADPAVAEYPKEKTQNSLLIIRSIRDSQTRDLLMV